MDSDDDTRAHKRSKLYEEDLRATRKLLDEARNKLDQERDATRQEREKAEEAIKQEREKREKLEEAMKQEREKSQETIQQHTQTIQTMAGTQKAMADGFNHIAKMGLKMLNTRKIEDRPTVEKTRQFLLENEENTRGCQIAFSW
jgi:chromosome segregation ATPase